MESNHPQYALGAQTTFAAPSWRGYALQLLTARGSLIAAAALLVSLVGAGNAAATVHTHGYLSTRDGTKLRYDVMSPDGPGPFPVLVNYEGYAAGSDASDNGVSIYKDRLLQRGYAIVGVSVVTRYTVLSERCELIARSR